MVALMWHWILTVLNPIGWTNWLPERLSGVVFLSIGVSFMAFSWRQIVTERLGWLDKYAGEGDHLQPWLQDEIADQAAGDFVLMALDFWNPVVWLEYRGAFIRTYGSGIDVLGPVGTVILLVIVAGLVDSVLFIANGANCRIYL